MITPSLRIAALVAAGLVGAALSVASGSADQDDGVPTSARAKKARQHFVEEQREAGAKYEARVKALREEYAKELQGARAEALKAEDLKETQRILAAEMRLREEDERPSVVAQGFHVIAARWGAESQWADVTENVLATEKDGVIKLVPQYANLPDPKFGTNKSLVVVYSIDGGLCVAMVGHDEMLVLPPR